MKLTLHAANSSLSALIGAGLLALVTSWSDIQAEDLCDSRVCKSQKLCYRVLSRCPGLEKYAEVLSEQDCGLQSALSLENILGNLLPSVVEDADMR